MKFQIRRAEWWIGWAKLVLQKVSYKIIAVESEVNNVGYKSKVVENKVNNIFNTLVKGIPYNKKGTFNTGNINLENNWSRYVQQVVDSKEG